MDMAKVGKRIKEKRVAMDMTQEQLAEMIGVKSAHISNIEVRVKSPALASQHICETL